MGITVLSAASLNSPGKGTSSPLPVDSGGADFAALLSQQISAPQLLDMPLQAAAGSTRIGIDPKDLPAEPEEEASAIDVGALLAAAGLLPAAPPPQQPRTAAEAPLLDSGREEGQLAALPGQLAARTDKGLNMEAVGAAAQEDPAAILSGGLQKEDAANIAVDARPASGNGDNFAAALAAQTQRAQPRHENGATATVNTPIHDSRWSQDFGEKIVWLAKNDQQVAQLNINPPQLGPMQITLNLNGDQASALFISAHAEVRQAIQDAMPQLREMLAGAGINLGQADVGAQSSQQDKGEKPQFSGSPRLEDDKAILRPENGEGTLTSLSSARSGRGMVDLFA